MPHRIPPLPYGHMGPYQGRPPYHIDLSKLGSPTPHIFWEADGWPSTGRLSSLQKPLHSSSVMNRRSEIEFSTINVWCNFVLSVFFHSVQIRIPMKCSFAAPCSVMIQWCANIPIVDFIVIILIVVSMQQDFFVIRVLDLLVLFYTF